MAADAHTVESKMDGLDPATRKPLIGPDGADYRRIDAWSAYGGPGSLKVVPHVTRSIFDAITLFGRLWARRYKGLDAFDMIVAMYQAAGEPQPKK